MFRWLAVLVLAGVVGLGAVLGARLGTDPTLVRSPLIGTPAPDIEWPYLEREGALKLADLRGRVVVVNFWASWCVPCRAEHPELVAASDAYADAGVTFVGVNYQDRQSTATAFLDELGRGESYEYVTDSGSRGAVDFGVYGVPETFVIDREGTIVAKIMGASNFPLLSSTLDQVLAGRSPGEVVNGPVQREPGG
ncbi:redoxin family protein [Cellulomonas fimi]|uniref:Redoxin family protein n=2 Tax=Cellulomonas fimi TaxID=1708 RepID=A0A7Y0QIC2_CELFI|nr:redoxin family protein [Cellulomonas fimi]